MGPANLENKWLVYGWMNGNISWFSFPEVPASLFFICEKELPGAAAANEYEYDYEYEYEYEYEELSSE